VVVLNTLIPLIVIVTLGAILKHKQFAPESFFKNIYRLVFWVGIPCLLFVKTVASFKDLRPAAKIFGVMFGTMLVCIVVGYILAWILRLPGRSYGAFVQGAFRSNLAYVGLPVVMFALESIPNIDLGKAEALAVLSIAPLIPLYNAGAILVLQIGQGEKGHSLKKQFIRLARSTAFNPLIIACVAGLLWGWLALPLPKMAEKTLTALGQMALPLALLGIGASINFHGLKKRLRPAVAAAVIKTGIAPLTGYLIGKAIGLEPVHLVIAILFLASPTAIISHLMAEQMDGDADLANAIVVAAVLLALPSLSIILLLCA
jgi:predicted permease